MTETRKFELVASMKDQASAIMGKIGRNITAGFKTGTAAVGAFRKALGSTQTLLTGLVAGAAIQRGVGAFNELAEGLRAVANQAAATNTTADSLYALRNAAGQDGIGFDQLSAALRTFTKNIGDARQGAATQNETLRRLGLTTEQFSGNNIDAVDQMALVADALTGIEDASVRTNLSLKLFGEDTGAALLPLLSRGGAALRDFAAANAALGKSFSSEQLEGVANYQRQLAALQGTLRNLGEQFVVQSAPQFIKFFTTLREAIEANGPFIISVLKELAQGFSIAFGTLIRIGGLLRRSFLGLQELSASVALAYSAIRGDQEGIDAGKARLAALVIEVEKNDAAAKELSQAFFDLQIEVDNFAQKKLPEFPGTDPKDAANVSKLGSQWAEFYRGFGENTTRAVNRFGDFYTAGLNGANQLVDGGLNRVGDAIGDVITGAKKGKEAFREFARGVLADLAKIIGRLVAMQLVSSIFGSAAAGAGGGGGGVPANEKGGQYGGQITKTIPLRRFERGGVVRRPTLALFGEGKASKGEAFVPLPDGRRIPVEQRGGGGGAVFNFNIQAWDGRDASRAIYAQRGQIRAMLQRDLTSTQAVRANVQAAAR
jgi:hypothetical protein